MRILLTIGAVSFGWASLTLAAEPTKTATVSTAKDRVMNAMRATAEALQSRSVESPERAAFVELLDAAEALRRDESVPPHVRDRLRGLARARLSEGAIALRRTTSRPGGERISRQFPAQAGAGGGGPQPSPDVVEAEKLIEIITGAIRPESWEVNGGLGTIRYWSLGHALIITNSADVHEQVGGLTGALRP